MRLIADGVKAQPWPLTDAEQAAMAARSSPGKAKAAKAKAKSKAAPTKKGRRGDQSRQPVSIAAASSGVTS